MKRKKALTVIFPLVAWMALSIIRASSAGGSENSPALNPDVQEPREFWCEPLGCYVPTQKDCPGAVDGMDLMGSPAHARVRGNQVRMHLTLKSGDNINMQFKFFEGDSLVTLWPEHSIQIEFGNRGRASWIPTPGNSMAGRFRVSEAAANTFRVKLFGRQRNSDRAKMVWQSPRITINYP
ncbi:hypothetical protein ACFL6R_05545 [Gemmatimonadota bacterium]